MQCTGQPPAARGFARRGDNYHNDRMDTPLIVVLTAFSDAEDARAVGAEVVERRLAACAQVSGAVTSIYRWDGAMQQEREFVLTIKADASRRQALIDYITARHPYDLPEVAVIPADASPAYLAWVQKASQC